MYKIDYIVDGNRRYYLNREWIAIAQEMKLSEDDIRLLRSHFDGVDSLYYELRELRNGFNTKPMTIDGGKAWIEKGLLIAVTKGKKPYRVKTMLRAKGDRRKTMYLYIGQKHYLHRIVAQTVYNELNKSLDNKQVHHRLIDKTLTKKANMIPYLVVMKRQDHIRLHQLLHNMRVYEFGSGK